jgi:hypothetical protein
MAYNLPTTKQNNTSNIHQSNPFLASDEASYINGAVIEVGGGDYIISVCFNNQRNSIGGDL